MKSVVTFMLVCTLCSASRADIPPRLESFLQKVQSYYDRHKAVLSMPNHKPSHTENMPSPDIIGAMILDAQTGLTYSPSTGNLYHPELNIGLEAASGTVVDFKTRKKYSLNELQKHRKNRNKL